MSSIVIKTRQPTIHKVISLWLDVTARQFIINLTKGRFKDLGWLLDDVDVLDINALAPLEKLEYQTNLLNSIIIGSSCGDKKYIIFELKSVSMNGRLLEFDYVDNTDTFVFGQTKFYENLLSCMTVRDNNEAVIKHLSYSFYDKNMIYVKLVSDKSTKILCKLHTRLLKSFALLLPLVALVFGDNRKHYYSSVKLICLTSLEDQQQDCSKTVFESKFLIELEE